MDAIPLPRESEVVSWPPRNLWLEHDFMPLSLKEMKYIYRELKKVGTSTLCQDDITELEICYQLKKYEESLEKEKTNLLKVGKEIISQQKIPFMKKPIRNK